MKPSGQRIRAAMVDAAERALRQTAQDVLDAAKRDVPIDDGELLGSATVETVRVGDVIEARVSFTAEHAATQEIGGRWKSKAARGVPGEFVKYRKHPGGGKDHFLSDALKGGARKYRTNLKKAVKEETGAR